MHLPFSERADYSPSPEILPGRLYDYPVYCDLLFRSHDRADWIALTHCWAHDAIGKIGRVLETACGSGRLMVRLARAGLRVEGIDVSSRALTHCNKRLNRAGFRSTARTGDLADFSVPRQFDAVICMLNGFRHLPNDHVARSHLASVARALRPGGLCVLGLELTPTAASVRRESRTMATRGRLTVISRLVRRSIDVTRRVERRDLEVDIHTPAAWRRIADTLTLRTYTAAQLEQLLGDQRGLKLVRSMDLDGAALAPYPVGPATERAVYVLRRSGRG